MPDLPPAPSADPHRIRTLAQLEALAGPVGEASLRKEVDWLHPHYQAVIRASPFAVLATVGQGGLDASPRGDPAGFVAIEDERTLLLPERRGNHRMDSLRNVVEDPRVALLFLVPGAGETLRVNGVAEITVAPELLARLACQGRPPTCVLRIRVQAVYFQCARAVLRSGLWDARPAQAPRPIPTAGAMLEALTSGGIDGRRYDEALPQRQRDTLY